jgi:succinate dehydrogenase / fumarate reductase flavoprotein subunit
VASEEQIDAAAAEALRPFSAAAEYGGGSGGPAGAAVPPENPYTLHQELQQVMNDLVGIIRRAPEMEQALDRLAGLRERARHAGVEGHRQFNPGWHLAIDLRNMLLVSECVARAALERTESRGGHTRDDHPGMDRMWRKVNLVCELPDTADAQVSLRRRPMDPIRADLLDLFERDELLKYLTDEELDG